MDIVHTQSVNLDIVVYFDSIPESENITASIKPIKLPNDSIDQIAKAEFDDFVMAVKLYLYAAGFDDLEKSYTSPYSEISEYFVMYKKSALSNNTIKCINYIRISDHDLSEEDQKAQAHWYAGHVDKLNDELSDIPLRIEHWRPRYITVNGQKYDSYDQALLDIYKRIKNWQ